MLRNTWIISWSSWPILRITWPMFRNNWTIPRNTWPLLGNTCPMQRNTWPMSRNSWPMPRNTWQMLRNTWTVDNLQKYPAMHRNSWPIRQEILGQLLEIPGQYLMLMPWNTCSTLGNSLAWIYFSGWTCPQDISLVASFAMVVQAQPQILKPPKPWVWDAFCKSFHLGFVVSCLTRVLNKVENSPPLTPPISAAYRKQGSASMSAPAQWWGGAGEVAPGALSD